MKTNSKSTRNQLIAFTLLFVLMDCLIVLLLLGHHKKLYPLVEAAGPTTGTDFGEELEVHLREFSMEFGDNLNHQLDGSVSQGRFWEPKVPPELGLIRLGPDFQALNVVFFHQVHCIKIIHQAFTYGQDEDFFDHLQHCLFYLQQLFLCDADISLEPGDFLFPETNEVVQSNGTFRKQCKDWSAITQFQIYNTKQFENHTTGISTNS